MKSSRTARLLEILPQSKVACAITVQRLLPREVGCERGVACVAGALVGLPPFRHARECWKVSRGESGRAVLGGYLEDRARESESRATSRTYACISFFSRSEMKARFQAK